MLKDVVSVIPSDPYLLKLKFEDRIEGTVALNELVKFEGVSLLCEIRQNSERSPSTQNSVSYAGPTALIWIPAFYTAASSALTNARVKP
jgi:hypothetical protein